jgi:hypothetical protein
VKVSLSPNSARSCRAAGTILAVALVAAFGVALRRSWRCRFFGFIGGVVRRQGDEGAVGRQCVHLDVEADAFLVGKRDADRGPENALGITALLAEMSACKARGSRLGGPQ